MKVEKSSQDLESEVIYAGLCIHCGSCNAFCPHMDFNKETGEAFVVDECAETVGLCYNACPRTFLPINKIEKKIFGENRIDLGLGVYKDIIQVKSNNSDDVLYNLVKIAFDEKIIEYIILGDQKTEKPPLAFPVIIDNPKDAKNYIPKSTIANAGPLITGIGQAYLEQKKKVGIIANPCHLQGLSKLLTSDFNTGAKETVSLKIGYACSSGGMSGCKFCIDFSGEFSDISYSPWGAPKGEIMLIIRTELGQKIVDKAVSKKLIEITEKNPNLSEMKKFINKKRKKNLKNLIGNSMISVKYLKLNIDQLKDFLAD
ncbi:MAG: Coenzyme F420 hydrogenase/dehydrogenase, beta subunit C-terminal domain [Candidatus Lokiarchaeota archaeon]|nr:Coenzyme F420 hydrogenase/dehydrogenase, beta subunit C-terminal domain [Candidatus Lokiarchaeota archaeon]